MNRKDKTRTEPYQCGTVEEVTVVAVIVEVIDEEEVEEVLVVLVDGLCQ